MSIRLLALPLIFLGVMAAGAALAQGTAPDPFAEVPMASSEALVQEVRFRPQAEPEYPTASRRKGECGTVYLQMHVGEDGHLTEITLALSSGFPQLDAAALAAAPHAWRVQPAQIAGKPVAVWTVRAVNFTLEEDGCKRRHALTAEETAQLAALNQKNTAAFAALVQEWRAAETRRYASEEPYRLRSAAGLKDKEAALLAYERFLNLVHCGEARYAFQDGLVDEYRGVRLLIQHEYPLAEIDRRNGYQWKGLIAFTYQRVREYRPDAGSSGWGDWTLPERGGAGSRLVYKKSGQWHVQTNSTDSVRAPASCAAVPPG